MASIETVRSLQTGFQLSEGFHRIGVSAREVALKNNAPIAVLFGDDGNAEITSSTFAVSQGVVKYPNELVGRYALSVHVFPAIMPLSAIIACVVGFVERIAA